MVCSQQRGACPWDSILMAKPSSFACERTCFRASYANRR
jgi:hypothetical protein